MWPVALTLGPFYLSTFGVCLAFGFLIASFFLFQAVKNDFELNPEMLFDLSWVTALGALIGARIWYIAFHYAEFAGSPILLFLFRERPGLSFIGGVIGGLGCLFLFTRINKVSFWKILDISTIPLLWVYLLGQIGSFFDGFSYGIRTTAFWGVSLFGSKEKYLPLPLIQLINTILLLLVVRSINHSGRKKHLNEGYLFLLVFTELSFVSSLLYWWRGDQLKLSGYPLEQAIEVAFTLIGLFLLSIRVHTIRFNGKYLLDFITRIRHNSRRKIQRFFPKKRYEVPKENS